MNIGRKIYYDKSTGNIIQNIGEKNGAVVETTIDEDFNDYLSLKERNRDTIGVIQLGYGDYIQDFRECDSYRVNPETLQLEFSYPNPNKPIQEPIYQKPLTEQISELTNTIDSILTDIIPSLMGGI